MHDNVQAIYSLKLSQINFDHPHLPSLNNLLKVCYESLLEGFQNGRGESEWNWEGNYHCTNQELGKNKIFWAK